MKKTTSCVSIPVRFLKIFLLCIIIFHILVTLVWGVGIMGHPVYQAPSYIRGLIQVALRIDIIFGIYLVVLLSKKKFFNIVLIVGFITISLLRFSLGFLAVFGFLFLVINFKKIQNFFKKKRTLVFVLLIIVPILVPSGVRIIFDIRDEMRGAVKNSRINFSAEEIFFGLLVGRLSSFSNSAIILERRDSMSRIVNNFPWYRYPQEALTVFYGGLIGTAPYTTYQRIMHDNDGFYTTIFSRMIGAQGVLLLGLYQSLVVLIVNLMTLLIIVTSAFRLGKYLNCPYVCELLFVTFSFNMMSGIPFEYLKNLLIVAIYIVIFLIINLLSGKSRVSLIKT